MSERFTTVSKSVETEIVEKRSRFIANVIPVRTEEDALYHLNRIKKKYSDARHNVYAYSVREDNIKRYSDDGEPAQTAGLPVMDFITKSGLTDILIVVTRYFGGILLGTGGLVHAYTKAAKECVTLSGIVEMVHCIRVDVTADYALFGKIQGRLIKKCFLSKEPIYTDKVKCGYFVPADEAESFKNYVVEITDSRAEISFGEIKYQPKYKNML